MPTANRFYLGRWTIMFIVLVSAFGLVAIARAIEHLRAGEYGEALPALAVAAIFAAAVALGVRSGFRRG